MEIIRNIAANYGENQTVAFAFFCTHTDCYGSHPHHFGYPLCCPMGPVVSFLAFLLLPPLFGDFLGMISVLVGDGQDLHAVLPKVDHGRSPGSNGSA